MNRSARAGVRFQTASSSPAARHAARHEPADVTESEKGYVRHAAKLISPGKSPHSPTPRREPRSGRPVPAAARTPPWAVPINESTAKKNH